MSFDCAEALPYMESGSFHVLLSYQTVLSFLGIIANVLFAYRYHHLHILPPTVQFLGLILIVTNITEASLFVIQTIHLFRYLMYLNPCDVLFPNSFCAIYRFIQQVPLFFPTFLMVALAADRVAASALKRPIHFRTSIISCILALAASIGFNCYFFRHTQMEGWSAYCGSISPSTVWDSVYTVGAMSFLELCTLITSFTTFIYEKTSEKTRIYDTAQRFRKRENIYVHLLVLPYMVFHFVLFCIYYYSAIFLPQFFDLHSQLMEARLYIGYANVIPVYCVLSPLLFAYIIHREKRLRHSEITILITQAASADHYFRNYGWS